MSTNKGSQRPASNTSKKGPTPNPMAHAPPATGALPKPRAVESVEKCHTYDALLDCHKAKDWDMFDGEGSQVCVMCGHLMVQHETVAKRQTREDKEEARLAEVECRRRALESHRVEKEEQQRRLQEVMVVPFPQTSRPCLMLNVNYFGSAKNVRVTVHEFCAGVAGLCGIIRRTARDCVSATFVLPEVNVSEAERVVVFCVKFGFTAVGELGFIRTQDQRDYLRTEAFQMKKTAVNVLRHVVDASPYDDGMVDAEDRSSASTASKKI